MMPALLISLLLALLATTAVAAQWRSVAKALDQEADSLRQQLHASRIERYRLKAKLRVEGYTPERVKRPPRPGQPKWFTDEQHDAVMAHIRQEDTASGQVRP